MHLRNMGQSLSAVLPDGLGKLEMIMIQEKADLILAPCTLSKQTVELVLVPVVAKPLFVLLEALRWCQFCTELCQ